MLLCHQLFLRCGWISTLLFLSPQQFCRKFLLSCFTFCVRPFILVSSSPVGLLELFVLNETDESRAVKNNVLKNVKTSIKLRGAAVCVSVMKETSQQFHFNPLRSASVCVYAGSVDSAVEPVFITSAQVNALHPAVWTSDGGAEIKDEFGMLCWRWKLLSGSSSVRRW